LIQRISRWRVLHYWSAGSRLMFVFDEDDELLGVLQD
jgi:hypothetical protein